MGVPRPQVLTGDRGHRSRHGDCDVVVVGGGPAGLMAARDLATAGFDVACSKNMASSARRCTAPGSSVSTPSTSSTFPARDCRRGACRALRRAGRQHCRPRCRSGSRGDRRPRALRSRSRRSAARPARRPHRRARRDYRSRAPSSPSRPPATAAHRHRARAASRLRRELSLQPALGLGVPRMLVHSAQLEAAFPPLDRVQVHFGRKWRRAASRGSCRSTARAAAQRLGLICDRDAGARFPAFAERSGPPHHLPDAWPEPRLKVLPLGPVARTWTDRMLAVGDAAGLVKPTTGGGIYYSLLTGHLAAGDWPRRCAKIAWARAACRNTRPAGAVGSAPRFASASRSAPRRPAERRRHRSPDRACPGRRHRSAPEADRRLQLAPSAALALLRHASSAESCSSLSGAKLRFRVQGSQFSRSQRTTVNLEH